MTNRYRVHVLIAIYRTPLPFLFLFLVLSFTFTEPAADYTVLMSYPSTRRLKQHLKINDVSIALSFLLPG